MTVSEKDTITCAVCGEEEIQKPKGNEDVTCSICGTVYSKGYQKTFWQNNAGRIAGVIPNV